MIAEIKLLEEVMENMKKRNIRLYKRWRMYTVRCLLFKSAPNDAKGSNGNT